ncbi:MAG: hypothetical protein V7752_06235 [Halopseudomonas sp.]
MLNQKQDQQVDYVEELYADDLDSAVNLVYSRHHLKPPMTTWLRIKDAGYCSDVIDELADDARQIGIEIKTSSNKSNSI